MYTTYAITDPRTRLFFYVGQTNNFERRQKEHLTAYRLRKPPRGSVKAWMKQLHTEGHTPLFTVLELVESEAASLESENRWVEKLAALGHPLFNRWEEHKELIEQSTQGVGRKLEAKVFIDGKAERVGSVEPNSKKTGYRVHIEEGIEIIGPLTIDILPPKDD